MMSHELSKVLPALSAAMKGVIGRISMREVLCAAAGLKPVRISCLDTETAGIISRLESHGLAVAVGTHSQVLAVDQGKGGWSSSVGPDGVGERWRHLYLSRNAAEATLMREAEEQGDDEEFGRILMIPPCCRRMFRQSMSDAMLHHYDFFRYSYPAVVNRVPWLLNVSSQYFDASMISHYPCSATCESSLKLAQMAWKIYAATLPSSSRTVRRLMRSICVFTERDGVFLFPDSHDDGDWIVTMGEVHSTIDSGMLPSFFNDVRRFRCPSPGRLLGESSKGLCEILVDGVRIVHPD